MSKKKIAVVLASDSRQAFALANVILGLKRYNQDLIDEIIVFHDINEDELYKIYSIWPKKIRFVQFNIHVFHSKVNSIKQSFIFPLKNYPHLIYAKYHIFDYINDFEYILWMDCDMLVQDSIEKLIPVNHDVTWRAGNNILANKFCKLLFNKDNDINVNKPNGGFIFYNCQTIKNKISNHNLTDECYELLLESMNRNIVKSANQSDEIVFGVLQYKYNLNVMEARPYANVFPNEVTHQTIVVHAVGDLKFWNSSRIYNLFQEWSVNAKELSRRYGIISEVKLDDILTDKKDIFSELFFSQKLKSIIEDIGKINNLNYYNYQLYILPIYRGQLDIKSIKFNDFKYRIRISSWGPVSKLRIRYFLICTNTSKFNLFETLFTKNDYIHSCKYNKKKTSSYYYLDSDIVSDDDIITKYKMMVESTFPQLESFI